MTIIVPAVLALTLVHAPVSPPPLAHFTHATTLREAIAQQHLAAPVRQPTQFGRPVSHATSSMGRKVAFAVTGVLVGFLAGATAGGAIDSAIGCSCDDPGLRGAVFGGFAGASAGAALGILLAR